MNILHITYNSKHAIPILNLTEVLIRIESGGNISLCSWNSHFQTCEEVACNINISKIILKFRVGFIKYMPVPDRSANSFWTEV